MATEATASTLATRLHNIGAIETRPTDAPAMTAEEAREAITTYCCEWAVCARVANKVLTFSAYFQAVYGEKLDGTKIARRVA